MFYSLPLDWTLLECLKGMMIYEYPTLYIHCDTLPKGEIITRQTIDFPLLSETSIDSETQLAIPETIQNKESPVLSDQDIKKALLADLVSMTQSIQ
jgi:hypothetical protein